jgi:hypothetical protein
LQVQRGDRSVNVNSTRRRPRVPAPLDVVSPSIKRLKNELAEPSKVARVQPKPFRLCQVCGEKTTKDNEVCNHCHKRNDESDDDDKPIILMNSTMRERAANDVVLELAKRKKKRRQI